MVVEWGPVSQLLILPSCSGGTLGKFLKLSVQFITAFVRDKINEKVV